MEMEPENDFDESEKDDIFYTGEDDVCESDLEISIRYMVHTKQKLDNLIRIADNIHNIEFYEIYDKIIKYIHLYCKHEYQSDLFDITPDRSKTIQYCRICEEIKP